MAIRKRVIIHGRVQGVGFRFFVESHATRRGIHGFVTNNADGTVEAELIGEKHTVDELLQLINQGPSLSHVSHVDIAEEENDVTITDFAPFHVK